MTRDRLASITNELSQSSNQVAALEEAIEAERASHIQTKFSCELLQVSWDVMVTLSHGGLELHSNMMTVPYSGCTDFNLC